jgi:hypothetical protein
MASYTTNYSLKKPLQTEYYNVNDFNDNADIIDSEIKKVDSNLKTKTEQLGENIEEVSRSLGDIRTGLEDIRTALKGCVHCVTVAASDTDDSTKMFADYVCDGVKDEYEINSALEQLSNGGKIYLFAGTYNCTGIIHIINPGITLCGDGYASHIVSSGVTDAIIVFGNYTVIKDLRIDFTTDDTSENNGAVFFNSTGGNYSRWCKMENIIINSGSYAFCDNYNDESTGGRGCVFKDNIITAGASKAGNLVGTSYRFRDNLVNGAFSDSL